MKLMSLQTRFVEEMPEDLEPGILYVSEKYGTAIHICACNTPECGRKTVTPLRPHWGDGWRYVREGDLVTLDPSIGNFQMPCRAHYFIKKNQIEWL